MTTKNPERWLILAHAFNMDGRAASHTITDKIPHLINAGIEVVVLSGVSGTKDNLVEHYQLWSAGPAGFRFELRHVLRQRLSNRFLYRLCMVLASILLLPFLIIEKLLRPVESCWSWWFSAYFKGRQLARQKPFDLIYSTGGAFAAHIAACALKKATGTAWLAEVHDPLVVPNPTSSAAQQKMQAQVECMIGEQADIAIWFTEQAAASAKARQPQLGQRAKVMLPGIDQPFDILPSYQPGAKFIVGHFGSLSDTRNLTPFIDALEFLQNSRPDLLATVELHVYGGPLDAISSAKITNSSVASCVHHFGRLEIDQKTGLSGRQQILQRMRSADVLLLLHGQDPACAEYIPSKLYEYLWMQRPILATARFNSQMVGMLSGQGHNQIVTNNHASADGATTQELAAALTQLFDRWRTQGLPDNGLPSPYTTQSAVTQLLGWVRQLPKGHAK